MAATKVSRSKADLSTSVVAKAPAKTAVTRKRSASKAVSTTDEGPRKASAGKLTRLNVRVREADDELIREAAAVAGESVTDFVTESAVERAHTILADQRRFVLDGPSWGLFVAGFSREPRMIPAIQKLFSEPSLVDEE